MSTEPQMAQGWMELVAWISPSEISDSVDPFWVILKENWTRKEDISVTCV